MDILERFLNYVSFHTDSDGSSDAIPTTPGQTLLLNQLQQEMKDLELENIHIDPSGQLYGFLPATDASRPNIGFIAHVDTVPCGKDVKPQIIHYEGGDIIHKNGLVSPVKIFDFMEKYKGQDLIITDGTTVLGADDKAGIAEIMGAVEYLKAHPELPHGRIGLAFTPDEEIGRSSRGFDIPGFGMDFAYTLDGSTLGNVECENFNGASALVKFNGISVHPGASKNKMKNAILLCHEFISMLPAGEDPAHTEDHEGFYHVGKVTAEVAEASLVMILRDHDMAKLQHKKDVVQGIADFMNRKHGENTVVLEMRDGAVNMKDYLADKMFIVERAMEAFRKAGVEPRIVPIRGGGDCNVLTVAGLPCPNLSTGGENFHGNHEFIPVAALQKMAETVVHIATAE